VTDKSQEYIDDIRREMAVHFDRLVALYKPYARTDNIELFNERYMAEHVDEMRFLLREIVESIESADLERTVACIEGLQEMDVDERRLGLDFERLEALIELWDAHQATLIYVPEPPSIHLVELTRAVDAKLIAFLASNPQSLFGMDPFDFERLIAELFSNNGFEVAITKRTRDGGKDIVAIQRVMNVQTKYLIECKRNAQHRKVSLSVVQRLYGVKLAEKANVGIVVTTSTFTKDAEKFARSHPWDLSLKDGTEVVEWLRRYKRQ
jgi:HJR/Mrr/RecB family endonuclease